MTTAQKCRLIGFNASLITRGVVVYVNAETNTPGVLCLVEQVDERTRQRLQVLDATITHILHVGRADLTVQLATLEIDGGEIASFVRDDTGNVYRVKWLQDDPQRPDVMFHCVTVEDVANL